MRDDFIDFIFRDFFVTVVKTLSIQKNRFPFPSISIPQSRCRSRLIPTCTENVSEPSGSTHPAVSHLYSANWNSSVTTELELARLARLPLTLFLEIIGVIFFRTPD